MGKIINLFGELVDDTPVETSTKGKAKRSNAAKGYPANPGSGPQGETCRTCQHSTCVPYRSRNYWKCGLLKAHWTRGLGSDIRLKSPACSLFAPKLNSEGGA